MSAFTGFPREGLQFLVDLALNNDRGWFQPRKHDYERLLKEPLEALCIDLAAEFEAHRVPLAADPRKSPFRIYRDTRFAKDKTPYTTHVAASFPWVGEGSGEQMVVGTSERHGGGYFHLSPEGTYMGGGMWHPEPARLAAFRRAVVNDTESTLAALNEAGFRKRFEPVHGDSLQRVPQGYDKEHPQAELLKLKDVTFGRELSEDEALSADLPRILAADFAAALPVMRFIASLDVE